MNNPALSFAIIFALFAVHQGYETVRALQMKRARKITFRKRYVGLTEDSADYWLATMYHGFAAPFCIAISAVIAFRLES